MTRQDDRTPEQRKTHQWAVVAKDKCMSGWGGAKRGASWCAWAVAELDDAWRVESWVNSRSEMRYVRVVNLGDYRVPKSAAHFHVYVADPGHPALAPDRR